MFLTHQEYASAAGPLHLLFSLPGMLFPRYPQDLPTHLLQFMSLNISIWNSSMASLF